MKRLQLVTAGLLVISLANSCKCSTPAHHEHHQESYVLHPFTLDSLTITGEPLYFSARALTSVEGILAADHNLADSTIYDVESSPIDKAFFLPEPGIVPSELTNAVMIRYNYATVMNHTMHSYELYCRKVSDETYSTKQDTLDLIAHDCIRIPDKVLKKALPLSWARNEAKDLLVCYAGFDGKENDENAFFQMLEKCSRDYMNLPVIVTEELRDEFSKDFWKWYDKRQFVPEYDDIAKIYLSDSEKEVSDEQIDHLKTVIVSESDIDRRTILALELLRMKSGALGDAALYLGDILESGIYTRYIVEAWIAWRAAVQMEFFSPSSYITIPNRYYDRIRVICLNTLLRHEQETGDRFTPCLLENLIGCQLLHRMGSIYGNESLAILANLDNYMFIQPSALGYDYLTEEK